MVRKSNIIPLLSAVVTTLMFPDLDASVPLSDFFPYSDSASQYGPTCDDCTSGKIPLEIPFTFYNRAHDRVIISPNGYIAFDNNFNEFRHVCGFKEDMPAVIAALWGDATTRHYGPGEILTYSERLDDEASFKKANGEIQAAYPDFEDMDVKWLFIVTWRNLEQMWPLKVFNTFQLILASDLQYSFIIFYYNDIKWTKGNYQGDHHLRAGFDASDGNPNHKLNLNGSCTPDVRNLVNSSNYGNPGKFLFKVDGNPAFDGADCENWHPGMPLALKPSFISMDGHKKIKIRGPCFPDGNATEVECVFTDHVLDKAIEKRLPGIVVDTNTAECPTPFFEQRASVEIKLILNNNIYLRAASNSEPTGSLMISSQRFPQAQVHSTGAQHESVELTWDPKRLSDDKKTKLSVCVYVLNVEKLFWSDPRRLNVTAFNVGTLILQKNDFAEQPRGQRLVTLSVQVGRKCMGTPGGEVPNTVITYIPDITDALLDADEKTINPKLQFAECPSVPPHTEAGEIQVCPPTLKQVKSDSRFKKFYEQFYDWTNDAKECYIQRDTVIGGHGTASCCYAAKTGKLQCSLHRDGTYAPSFPFKYHPEKYVWLHYQYDVLSWYLCCHVNGPGSGMCKRYFVDLVSDCGSAYVPLPANGITGDPHYVSLDNFKFTFNGFGEYILIKNNACQVQIRTEPYKRPKAELREMNSSSTETIIGNTAPGTIISGLAFHCEQTDVLELLLDPARTVIQPVYKGKIFKFPEGLTDTNFGPIFFSTEPDDENVPVYTVGLLNGMFNYQVKVDAGTISVLSSSNCTKEYGEVGGLVGDCDGNPENDLKPRNGNTPLPTDATLEEIHHTFGETWRVTINESLFTYTYGTHKSYKLANNLDFVPMLTVPDPSSFSPEIQAVCGINTDCYFDYNATGSIKFAEGTVRHSEKLEKIVQTVQERFQEIRDSDNATAGNVTSDDDSQYCTAGMRVEVGTFIVERNFSRLVCPDNYEIVGYDTVPCGEIVTSTDMPCCRKKCVGPGQGLLRKIYCYYRNFAIGILFGPCA